MKTWRNVERAIEEDLRGSQLRLPFPDEKTIDVPRACSILHVSPPVIYRLMATPLEPGSDQMALWAYQTTPHAPHRIDYPSLVRFLDLVRERHGIPDRRSIPVFGRRRDDDLLPFPWSDTIPVQLAAEALSVHPSKVLTRIESGQLEAYQLARVSPWRISQSSLARLISSFGHASRSARPYGSYTSHARARE